MLLYFIHHPCDGGGAKPWGRAARNKWPYDRAIMQGSTIMRHENDRNYSYANLKGKEKIKIQKKHTGQWACVFRKNNKSENIRNLVGG